MKKILLLAFTLLMFLNVAAQNDTEAQTDANATPEGEVDIETYFIDHTTTMGERMIMISRKYMVDPDDIYEFNAVVNGPNGLEPGTIIKIPLHKSHKKDLDKFKEQLIKKNGGRPIQVPAPPPIKKKTEEEEEEE